MAGSALGATGDVRTSPPPAAQIAFTKDRPPQGKGAHRASAFTQAWGPGGDPPRPRLTVLQHTHRVASGGDRLTGAKDARSPHRRSGVGVPAHVRVKARRALGGSWSAPRVYKEPATWRRKGVSVRRRLHRGWNPGLACPPAALSRIRGSVAKGDIAELGSEGTSPLLCRLTIFVRQTKILTPLSHAGFEDHTRSCV